MFSVTVKSVYVLNNGGNLKGFAKILYGNITIHGVRIIESKNAGELFVGMPRERSRDNKFHPLVAIEDADLARTIEEVVLEAYYAKIKQPARV